MLPAPCSVDLGTPPAAPERVQCHDALRTVTYPHGCPAGRLRSSGSVFLGSAVWCILVCFPGSFQRKCFESQ